MWISISTSIPDETWRRLSVNKPYTLTVLDKQITLDKNHINTYHLILTPYDPSKPDYESTSDERIYIKINQTDVNKKSYDTLSTCLPKDILYLIKNDVPDIDSTYSKYTISYWS